MSKVIALGTKIYKPEILECPLCSTKLIYKHTMSNKIIQFTSSKKYRIRNLGYGCPKCNDGNIYFSQTAAKMCFKGYTYSAKVICSILYYKDKGYPRDEICHILSKLGIVISDRNIDNIYHNFAHLLTDSYLDSIKKMYDEMFDKFKQVRISIDILGVDEKHYVCVRNFFSSEVIGLHLVNLNDSIDNLLKDYLLDSRLTYVVTVRRQFPFYKQIREIVNKNVEILEFAKF